VDNVIESAAKHVLVVDDYADTRAMCTEYLEFHGFRVSSAGDGREAVRKAQADRPDLVIMDLSLPTIDGWAAIELLKKDGATRAIPVLVLTGHALSSMRDRARDAGCAGFLTKPCLPQDLLDAVTRILAEAPVGATAAPAVKVARPAAKRSKKKR
jgi:two-component system cell cycle response regulator DivK